MPVNVSLRDEGEPRCSMTFALKYTVFVVRNAKANPSRPDKLLVDYTHG